MTDSKPPTSGRELAAWLHAQTTPPLVTVSGLARSGGRPSTFIAAIHAWNSTMISVKPTDGGSPAAAIVMPAKWMEASDAPLTILAFDGRGFTVFGSIRITYLDDKDPFA
jgi:hypothetical protein